MIVLKRLRPTDLDRLRELNGVFAEAFKDEETHLKFPPSDVYLQKLLGADHVIILAAICDAKVVGGLVAYNLEKYEQERSEIYIYDLAVQESMRRKGIAKGFIERLKLIGKELGAWVIFVQADKVDTPAIKLYESLGSREEPYHFDISVD